MSAIAVAHPRRPELVSRAVDTLAAKWSVPVLLALCDGPLRYNRLLDRTPGVSRRMLTTTLRQLAVAGLVERREMEGRGRRVQYALTPAGRELMPALRALEVWARDRQG
jgi:DNA-binding HxlR family transcriptional regulator